MKKQDYVKLFHSMHSDFFERSYIKELSENYIFNELILDLNDFDCQIYEKTFDSSITFGFYNGNLNEILEIVKKVDDDWAKYFGKDDRIYCGYFNGRVVSFCIVEDMGTHEIDGRRIKVGGPGCVGALPEFRDRGIALTMIKYATQILKDEGYDFSYIHYTHIPDWYSKLGYKIILKWSKKGII